MLTAEAITRPRRWDAPFGTHADLRAVDRLLSMPPFNGMNAAGFPERLPLRSLLENDTRLVRYDSGDLIIREGEYGTSAYLLLHGSAQIVLDDIDASIGQPAPARRPGLLSTLTSILRTPAVREARTRPRADPLNSSELGVRDSHGRQTMFLQDVPRVLGSVTSKALEPGELFGEIGALTRTPRAATVFAETDCLVLEIRWQGLRDLMRYAPELKQHVDHLYRKNSLWVHLSETPLLRRLSEEQITKVADATRFETHGSFDWHSDLAGDKPEDLFERIQREPLVAEEGDTPDGLLLLRSGFGRVSRRRGDGHQTVSYIGKGAAFGAAAMAQGFKTGHVPPLQLSLRAVGYLDVLVIPAEVCIEIIAPSLPDDEREALCREYIQQSKSAELPARTLDFLVDRRLVNGEQTMVIDLNRCTRCDDCVRACATTHQGNPRFVRQGPIHEHFQYTNACMHCVDPVCMIGCPTGAIHRDVRTGVVRINDPTCIGCSTCANSCPYHNIRMVEARSPRGAILTDDQAMPIVKATKCDLCSDIPTGPACQHACPHDALVRLSIAQSAPLTELITSRQEYAPPEREAG